MSHPPFFSCFVLQPPLNERNFSLRPVFRDVDPSLTRELFPAAHSSTTTLNWEQQQPRPNWESSGGGGSSGPNNNFNNPISSATTRSKFAVPPEPIEQVIVNECLKTGTLFLKKQTKNRVL